MTWWRKSSNHSEKMTTIMTSHFCVPARKKSVQFGTLITIL
ncbi:hypothetical protein DAQ1742_03794 [Dickeya aquatica]|uniref:Uncharacterized protein n=1 Tax=Dickeya aquatica TaxID=1401087 RepID=A0A375AF10_9GAMM|nr:hypothetical protein DAQ1742_03794 [Dickeya aquatica]